MKRISAELLDEVTALAKQSPRLRMNHNFHPELSDPVQRLLNALEPGTYIRPHKHFTREESFIILRGKALAVTFHDNGIVRDFTLLNGASGAFGVEFEENTFHMLISLESGTVVYEIKEGPFVPHAAECQAAWAPDEGDPESVAFLKDVIAECMRS